METLVNPDYIRRANSASHFDAGDGIEQEAQSKLAQFDAEFPTDGLTDEQKQYLDERRADWRKFVVNHYNEYCRRRAEYMPVTVCGPARYPGRQMEKKVDRIMALSGEFSEKVERFLNNTRKRLESLVPLEKQLEGLRAGKWYRGETIPASDPHVIEKLGAMLEHMESEQERMKAANKAIRKGKTPEGRIEALKAIGYTEAQANEIITPDCFGGIGYAHFSLTNNNANIKRIRERIAHIKAEREAPTIQGWKFDGGEVIANRDADRLQILFDEKPDFEKRARLRKAAFKWSPRFSAWQRQLTRNAVYAAQNLLGGSPSAE
jgi:hypothetical protein